MRNSNGFNLKSTASDIDGFHFELCSLDDDDYDDMEDSGRCTFNSMHFATSTGERDRKSSEREMTVQLSPRQSFHRIEFPPIGETSLR